MVTRNQPLASPVPQAGLQRLQTAAARERHTREGGLRTKGRFKRSLPDTPLITVVTVVLNGRKHLEEAIESVTNQTYENIEYLIIDGGSLDGTIDIIKKYDQRIDYWVSERDAGIYDAMNKSLNIATGDWLIFIGADDVLHNCLEEVATKLVRPHDIYYGNVELLSSKTIYAGKYNRYKLMQQNICHQTIFYPRTIYKSHQYDIAFGMLADYKYNIELWGRGHRFNFIPLTVSRFNDYGASSHKEPRFKSKQLALIKDNFGILFALTKSARNGFAAIKRLFA